MKKVFLSCALLAALAVPASAKDWQIDAAHSSLTFTGTQDGEKFSGGFKKFTTQIALDPAHPAGGKIAATIDTGSAYAGSSDRDAMLPQSDWFDVAKFPTARFTSTAIRKTGPQAYEADATLSIKSVTQKVVLPFTLAPEGDHWRAKGHIVLKRNDYNLGMSGFGDQKYVAFPVDVAVDIVARPPSAK